MKYIISEEISDGNNLPYLHKDAIQPNTGDELSVTTIKGGVINAVCVHNTYRYKGDACLVCPLGNEVCLHIPMKCREAITFVDINILEDL